MIKWFAFVILIVAGFSMLEGAPTPPDPFVLDDSLVGTTPIYRSTTGLTPRSQVIDPTKKTLVLIADGQSQSINIAPTLYTPANTSVIDNFNIYDGASYPITGPLLGTQAAASPYGPGNISPRIADKFVTNGNFDRVIIVPMGIGATSIDQHANGSLSGRIGVVMRRLASRGITPATTGATFAYLWMQGETDQVLATSQVNYAAGLATVYSNATSAGFSGRMFICKETYVAGATSAAIQAAQTGFVNGTTIFDGGDMDSLGSGSRQADNLHFNDAGMASAATLIYNAMHASGAPY